MEYYQVHVSHDVTPPPTRSPNESNDSEEQRFKRKQELSRCGVVYGYYGYSRSPREFRERCWGGTGGENHF